MQALQCIRFGDLPDPLRTSLALAIQRFDKGQDSSVVLAVRTTRREIVRRAVQCLIAAVLLWFLGAAAFGRLGAPAAVQSWPYTLLYAAGLAVVLALPFTFWPVFHRPRLPFKPGVYFFPDTVVDARSPWLDIHTLGSLKKFEARHVLQRGRYSYTALVLVFTNGQTARWRLEGRETADAGLAKLREKGEALRAAARAQNWAACAALDPFMQLRVSRQAPPPSGAKGAQVAQRLLRSPVPAAILAGFVLAQPLWFARNIASDRLTYQAAQERDTEASYLQYLKNGWRFTAQATAALPSAALKDAVKTGTVVALRDVLKRYPASGFEQDVASRVNKIYADAFQRFKARTGNDVALIPFVERLLNTLERSGDSTVLVRFMRRDVSALERFDRFELPKYKKALAPVSTHFAVANMGPRERRIVEELTRGFRTVFPEDVLKLTLAEGPSPSRPTLEIDYEVKSSGVVYTSELTQSNFVGVVYRFDMRLEAQPESRSWSSSLEVLPPKRFTVRSANGDPGDGLVYAEMSDRAFDLLGGKLSSAFFGTERLAR